VESVLNTGTTFIVHLKRSPLSEQPVTD